MRIKTQKRAGPKFVKFFGPLLDALRLLGGSGTPSEVTKVIAEKLSIPEEEQNELLKSGAPRFANQVAWARNYLKLEGLLDSSRKGVWVLTEAGAKTHLSDEEARKIFRKWASYFQKLRQNKAQKPKEKTTVEEDTSLEETYPDHREILLSILKKLPPAGFEAVCQRLLRDSGFDSVVVTGRSGDGGIDGHGVLQINPFVTFKVLFQCKRYDKNVSPSHIREFQGAIGGRADKGIIITTGSFSVEARKEAIRDGASPVELVDGQKLVEMFEILELGLKPKTVYEIDTTFFEQYSTYKQHG